MLEDEVWCPPFQWWNAVNFGGFDSFSTLPKKRRPPNTAPNIGSSPNSRNGMGACRTTDRGT